MANAQQTPGANLFGAPVAGEDDQVAQLQAELQVEKDRHRVLVEKARKVETTQKDKDAEAAAKLLEQFTDDASHASA